jgi:hypothetical protein
LLASAATITVAGTCTAVLLLDRLTLTPPVAAAPLRVTVQVSVPEPVIEAALQVRLLSCELAVSVAALVVLTIDPQPLSPTAARAAATRVSHPAGRRRETRRALRRDRWEIHGSPPGRAPPGSNEKRKGTPYILTSCIVPAFWRIRARTRCPYDEAE